MSEIDGTLKDYEKIHHDEAEAQAIRRIQDCHAATWPSIAK